MSETSFRYPPLIIVAVVCLIAGTILLATAVLLQPVFAVLKGLILISIALLLFWGGVMLNHPRKKMVVKKAEDDKVNSIKRISNPCALGNLCIIFSLLLFFIGISSLIYFR
jgi:hypothetical protein